MKRIASPYQTEDASAGAGADALDEASRKRDLRVAACALHASSAALWWVLNDLAMASRAVAGESDATLLTRAHTLYSMVHSASREARDFATILEDLGAGNEPRP